MRLISCFNFVFLLPDELYMPGSGAKSFSLGEERLQKLVALLTYKQLPVTISVTISVTIRLTIVLFTAADGL